MVSCEGASRIWLDYELKELYLYCQPEQQATPKQVEKVIKSVENKIPVVFL